MSSLDHKNALNNGTQLTTYLCNQGHLLLQEKVQLFLAFREYLCFLSQHKRGKRALDWTAASLVSIQSSLQPDRYPHKKLSCILAAYQTYASTAVQEQGSKQLL